MLTPVLTANFTSKLVENMEQLYECFHFDVGKEENQLKLRLNAAAILFMNSFQAAALHPV